MEKKRGWFVLIDWLSTKLQSEDDNRSCKSETENIPPIFVSEDDAVTIENENVDETTKNDALCQIDERMLLLNEVEKMEGTYV